MDRPRPIDIRHVDWLEPGGLRSIEPRQNVWLRADGRLPDDPILHTIVLTYASDMTLLDTSTRPHGGTWFDPTMFLASLDHAMWFHRSFRADDWMLYAQDSPNATGGRGLSRGLVVHPRRHAGRHGDARGPDPPAAVTEADPGLPRPGASFRRMNRAARAGVPARPRRRRGLRR